MFVFSKIGTNIGVQDVPLQKNCEIVYFCMYNIKVHQSLSWIIKEIQSSSKFEFDTYGRIKFMNIKLTQINSTLRESKGQFDFSLTLTVTTYTIHGEARLSLSSFLLVYGRRNNAMVCFCGLCGVEYGKFWNVGRNLKKQPQRFCANMCIFHSNQYTSTAGVFTIPAKVFNTVKKNHVVGTNALAMVLVPLQNYTSYLALCSSEKKEVVFRKARLHQQQH